MSKADVHARTLKLRLFGTFQACLGEKPLPPLRSRKGDWLLALLVLRGSAVSRLWLAGTLWPESEESRALLYLRRELTYIRKALGEESDRIVSTGRSLHLDLAGVDCDVAQFDAAIVRADESSLDLAVSVYCGTLLEGCYEEWVTLERSSREQAYLNALERLAESAALRGDSSVAVSRLRAVVAVDPLRESTQRALMKALADIGDSAAAIQVYRDLRLCLRNTLNTEADPETTLAFHRIHDSARRRTQSASQATRTSREPRITRIPVPLTPLIGRSQEMWEVRQRLRKSRLLTLTGTGGVGKTRLAIEIAEAMKDDFAGGACFVELAQFNDPALVAREVMEALGLKSDARRTPVETLVDRLASSDLLLVLDNCEHLVQPCAELAGSLLAACPHLRILTTSRQPLGIAGESVWPVPPLAVPPEAQSVVNRCKDLIAEYVEYEAVALFVERAQQIRSDFTLTVHNVEAVSQVCRRLDGIPLAIELAAARVRSLTVEDIDSRLDERFQLLTGGSRTALPRHQTLRSLVDWSYDLLTDPERALFCRLSAFAGGWTLEAAEKVCAGGPVDQREVLDLLTSLTDKSLVAAETVGPRVRYRLLETMRQYARDRMVASGDVIRWRDRHLAFFVTLAEAAEPHLVAPDQQKWLDLLEKDHDNIRAALQWSREERSADESGLRLSGALWRFWVVRGYVGEGRARLTGFLENKSVQPRSTSRAKALYGAGNLASQQGDNASARVLFEESLVISREIGERHCIAMSLNGLGLVESRMGNYVGAQGHYEDSLAMFRQIGDQRGIALALNNLGDIASKQGDSAGAHSLYSEGLAIRREIADVWGIANSLGNLGTLAFENGDLSSGRELLDESLTIRREIGDRGGIAWCLIDLGSVVSEQRDFAFARRLFEESMTIERELGELPGVAESLNGIASVEAAAANPLWAAKIWGAAERLREEISAPMPPIERLRYEAQVATARTVLRDNSAFDAAWQAGRAMTIEQAIELATLRYEE